MPKPDVLDQFQQIHELNRVFLGMLQSRVRQCRPCLGLPAVAHAALASAGTPVLEAVAAFPRALFQLDMAAAVRAPRRGVVEEDEHDVSFSTLFAARQLCRESAYRARLMFGLEPADIDQLRGAGLGALQQLACVPGLLLCAYREQPWFWYGLLTATRPELRRQLTLMALQPRIRAVWPQRRPPQPAA
jgi:hypothetical protein